MWSALRTSEGLEFQASPKSIDNRKPLGLRETRLVETPNRATRVTSSRVVKSRQTRL